MTRVAPDAQGLSQAAEALRQGGVVVYPTETVYGLGADPFNPSALERLFRIKQRDPSKPVLLIVSGHDQLQRLVTEVSPASQRCMDAFWPGPVSLVLPAAEDVPCSLAPRGKVCVRWPSCHAAVELCRCFGGPIISTSANRSGAPPATDLDELALPDIALAVDAGPLAPSRPSTVYDPDEGLVLRQGAVPEAELAACHRGFC